MTEQETTQDQGASDAMLTGLKQVPGGVWRTYLAPDAKVVFESLNKNACTSLKWMMAELAGEDLDGFRAGPQPYIDDSEPIHNRDLWKVSPRLDALDAEQRAQIHPDNGWFVFAVVRDPRLRLFSAWQNKLLIETPFSHRWSKEWWYPRHPLTAETVIEDFAKFVELCEQDPPHWLRAKDAHFRDQVEMLAEDSVPYTRIYEISEMKQLQADLAAHLESVGRPVIPLPRANPTPLRPIGALYANGIKERIEKIYAADFERFGHLWDFTKTENAEPWTKEALNACEQEAVLGRRIGELYRIAKNRGEKLEKANARIAELEQRATVKGLARAKAAGAKRRLRRS
ncbi:sulfotransferase family 2 domain-containing protein [Nocardioides caeni]|uniref:Sulfotransferase family protein n=1 Tax=Nocardioides caeni TaxID=574700 RepID=A0A4V4HK39_9ACTN|nr:sulfotransferase family 2 domain-containing protein [Nocardioides caeni]THV12936.1 sulfotransferase family protein [Nocardioides caeni]